MSNKPTWQLAEQICDVSTVDEAIRTFVEDNTGDNAIGVVLAVLEHQAATEAAKATGTAGEIDADAEMAKVKRDVELMGVGFLVDGKRCSLDRITWFNRPGDTWLPPPPGYPTEAARQPAPALEAKGLYELRTIFDDLSRASAGSQWTQTDIGRIIKCRVILDGIRTVPAATAAPVLSDERIIELADPHLADHAGYWKGHFKTTDVVAFGRDLIAATHLSKG